MDSHVQKTASSGDSPVARSYAPGTLLMSNERRSFGGSHRSKSELDEGRQYCQLSIPHSTGHGRIFNTGKLPVQDQNLLQLEKVLKFLSDILSDRKKREAFLAVKAENAQLLVDFMYNLLSLPASISGLLISSPLRKHILIALRKLCENSMLYPQCYVLNDIKCGLPEDGGGYCDIYKGSWTNGQQLCLKVIRLYQKSDTDRLLKLCAREAIIWGQLRHPNILPFYGIYYLDKTQKRICLVSPWQDNGNIVTYLERNPLVPRKPFCCDVANGLNYLHAESIIHGDLKGLNVLVSASGRACITDFGLSMIKSNKTLGITVTNVAHLGHTNRWASPELLEDGSQPTWASDIWAFGCVCYEILTQLPPFHDCSLDIHVVRKLVRGDLPARLDIKNSSAPDGIDLDMQTLISRCWSFEPDHRPSCTQILSELAAGNEPFFALPSDIFVSGPSRAQEFQLAMERHTIWTVDLEKVQNVLEREGLAVGPAIMHRSEEDTSLMFVKQDSDESNPVKNATTTSATSAPLTKRHVGSSGSYLTASINNLSPPPASTSMNDGPGEPRKQPSFRLEHEVPRAHPSTGFSSVQATLSVVGKRQVPSVSEFPNPHQSLESKRQKDSDNLTDYEPALEDPAWKLLSVVLPRHGINGDWKNFVMFICYDSHEERTERCLSYDEKPLMFFQKLKDSRKNPTFMLKRIGEIHSPIVVAQQKHAAREALSTVYNGTVATQGRQKAGGNQQSSRSTPIVFPALDGQVSYAVAVYPYMAEEETEFDVDVGDTYIILSRGRGWWFVQHDPTGFGIIETDFASHAWVPAGCLLEINIPVGSAVAEANAMRDTSWPGGSSRTPILPSSIVSEGYPCIAIMDYDKKGDQELELTQDDQIRVFKYYNHWSYAVKEQGGDRGWVPSWLTGKRTISREQEIE